MEIISNKTIIITGATGQMGSMFSDFLLEQGHTVIGTIRRLSVPNHENIKHISSDKFSLEMMDLGDASSINLVVEKYKPDYFINCAANSFVGDSWKCPEQHIDYNCSGVIRELEAIKRFSPRTRYYNFGTSEEMGDIQYSPQDEKHPLLARSPYGASKICARQIVKTYRESYDLYAIQGWNFNFESPRRGVQFVTRKITMGVARIKKAIDGYIERQVDGVNRPDLTFDPISLGNLESQRDFGYCGDTLEGVWRQLNQDIYRDDIDLSKCGWSELVKNLHEYALASGKTHTIRAFIEEAFNSAEIILRDANPERIPPINAESRQIAYTLNNGQPVVVIDPKFYRPNDVTILLGDPAKARKELGWSQKVGFKELVGKMVAHDISLLK